MEEFRKDRYIFSNKPGVIDVSEKSKKAREQQIKNFNKELFEYEVLLKDLALDRPNEKEKNLILNVAYYIAKDYDVVSSFKAKKVLNIGLVSRKTRISKKFLERWKHYLITYILIMESTNYKYIQDYLRVLVNDNIDEEIADVLWVLLCIANQTGVDITTAFQKSMDKKTKRDNKRHINNPKLKDHGRE